MMLLKTMPDIDETFLQLIDVMKLVDLLLLLLPILQYSGFISLLLGGHRYGEMNAGVSRSSKLIVSHARLAAAGALQIAHRCHA